MNTQCRSSLPLQGIACFHLAVLLCATLSTSSTAFSAQDGTFLAQRTSVNFAGKHSDPVPGNAEDVLKKAATFPEEIADRLNVHVALGIAFVWIALIGSAPIFIHVLEHGFRGPVTKTMLGLSVLMWAALFGGLFAFTNIVLFQSPRFERVRSLTVVECTYFMSQVITTVGYGDITPAYPRGQVFVAIYAVFAFLVIAELMAEMMKVVTAAVHTYKEESEKAMSTAGVGKPSAMPLCRSFALFATFAGIWVLFFHYFPGEGKTWMEAVYMAIITMATIGLGAITPLTEGGMIFAAFFMLFGAASLAKVVIDFSTFTLELALWERWSPEWLREHLQNEHNVKDPANMTEVEFIKYTLVENRMTTKEKLDSITSAFSKMKPRRGAVDTGRVEKLVGIATPDPTGRQASTSSSDPQDADLYDPDTHPESYRHRGGSSTPRIITRSSS